MTIEVDILVVGAGQAGLSSAYHLTRLGLDFVILDGNDGPGGAWRHRWPSLTLSTVNGIHDLPGLAFADAVDAGGDVQAATAVPRYFAAYEARFDLPVRRPVAVRSVAEANGRLRVETDEGAVSARGLINATGTWATPNWPVYPGAERFRGRQLHTRDYTRADDFAGQTVVVVGGGISALQHLAEISRVAETIWVTRRKPKFRAGPFTREDGRAAVAAVEDRVRRGLPPGSLASVTGIPVTADLRAARDRGALDRRPMFAALTETGVRWPEGTEARADAILWATGFRSSLDHLAPLGLREASGGITMTGRLATQVAADPRIHLVGYGPSASTIGANRAGRTAARELADHLGLRA